MNKGLKCIIACLLCLHFGSGAFIYELKVLRKKNSSQGNYHYFIGCGDFHDKAHPANKEQRAAIEQILAGCDKDSTLVLLEDLSSKGSSGRHACGRFFVNSRGGVLGGLAEKAREQGVTVDNLEYRYCRVSSLGPVLNNLTSEPKSFPSVAQTSVTALAKEIDQVVKEIESYDDGAVLDDYYRKDIVNVMTELNKLGLAEAGSASIADYLVENSNDKNRLDVLKHLLTFDSILFDAKLAHAIVNADQKNIIAFAGGSHIGRVATMLIKDGYEQLESTKIAFTKEHDLRFCLGSNIVEGKYCVRPKPIALDLIKKLLK